MARTLLRSTLLGAALATFAVAPASAAELFKVAARISQGGELVAEPVMLVNAQAPAKVCMTDGAPYEFSVHLAPVDGYRQSVRV